GRCDVIVFTVPPLSCALCLAPECHGARIVFGQGRLESTRRDIAVGRISAKACLVSYRPAVHFSQNKPASRAEGGSHDTCATRDFPASPGAGGCHPCRDGGRGARAR